MTTTRNVITFAAVASVAAGLVTLMWSLRLSEPAGPAGVDYPATVDLGPREFGQIAEGRFRVANHGGSDLLLTRFSTSCSCAGVEIEEGGVSRQAVELRVLPGHHVDLSVRISVGTTPGLSQDVAVGFMTNAPDHPQAVVRLSIPRVTGGVYAEPVAVVFGELAVGRPAARMVRLYSNGAADRRVREVRSRHPDRFAVRLVPLPELHDSAPHETAGQLVAVIEVVQRTDRPGKVDGTLEVHLADETRPPDTLAVLGEVVPEVVARPAGLVLPRHAGGQPVLSGQVALTSRDGVEMAISVEAVPDGLIATVRKDPDNSGQWLVDITAQPAGSVARTVAVRLRADLTPGGSVAVEVPVTLHPTTP